MKEDYGVAIIKMACMNQTLFLSTRGYIRTYCTYNYKKKKNSEASDVASY